MGGVFRHVRDLVEEQSKQGHKVGIVCDSSTTSEHDAKLFEKVLPHLELGLIRLPIGRSIGVSDAKALWASYKQIKELQPDILHGHGAKGGAIARIIGSVLRVSRCRVARLYSPHGGSLHYDKASTKGRIVFAVERLLERLTDSLCFVCQYEKKTYETKIGKPTTAAHVIYNGVREDEFIPVLNVDNAADFLFIGEMRELKGPHIFIDAFYEANKRSERPLSAIMVGNGPDKQIYIDQIKARNLEAQITMLPAMPARNAFAMAQTVIVPSLAEAMPYIVLEALAGGKPVLASDVGGIPEIFPNQSEALLIPNSIPDLTEKLNRSLTDKEWLYGQLPVVEVFKEKFTTSNMCKQMTQLYRSL